MKNLRSARLIQLGIVSSLLVVDAAAAAGESRDEPVNLDPVEVRSDLVFGDVHYDHSQSVLTQTVLDHYDAKRTQDISGLAPNLFTSNSDTAGYGDVLSLRGMANSIFFSAPSVALYVDGVPGNSVSSYPSSLGNIFSVSVNAGPQGTRHGRNAPGGLIEINSRRPSDQHRGVLQADYGSFNEVALRGAVDGPLGDAFGYSAGLGYASRDGYIDNVFLGRTADDRSAVNGRASLSWDASDVAQLRLTVFGESIRDDASRLSSLFSPDPYVVSSNENGITDMDRRNAALQAAFDLDWGRMILSTSWQKWDMDPSTVDLDLSELPLARSEIVQGEDMWTGEIRFESNPGSERFDWRGGVFYLDSSNDGDAEREFIVPPDGVFIPPGFVQTERTVFEIGQRNLAGYGSLDIFLTDQATVELGARVERHDSDIVRTKTSSNNMGFPAPQDLPLDESQSSGLYSATAGLRFALSETMGVFGRTSLANKPDGYSAFTADPALARFDDEQMWANEIGVDFSRADGTLQGSLLAFWNVIDDYQFERTVPNSTDFIVINADQVTATGVEARFAWRPVEFLALDLQAGYNSTKFDAHLDAAGNDVSGNRVPFVPEYTVRTGATFDLGGGFYTHANISAFGKTAYNEQNTSAFVQGTYAVVNMEVGYRRESWIVTLYGRNLFEEDYYQFLNPEIFAGSPGAPQRFGVRVGYTY